MNISKLFGLHKKQLVAGRQMSCFIHNFFNDHLFVGQVSSYSVFLFLDLFRQVADDTGHADSKKLGLLFHDCMQVCDNKGRIFLSGKNS